MATRWATIVFVAVLQLALRMPVPCAAAESATSPEAVGSGATTQRDLAAEAEAPGASREEAPPNVVVVVLDAAAARHFGAYGYGRPTTPQFDRLARESILFERAYAQWPATVGSVASVLTGRYPPKALRDGKLHGEKLAEMLRDAGYATAGFSENPWLTRSTGFADGFDTFRLEAQRRMFFSPSKSDAVEPMLEWVSAVEDQPFFAYVHLLPPHSPYAPPEPFRGRIRRGDETCPEDPFLALFLGCRPLTAPELRRAKDGMAGQISFTEDERERLVAAYDENLMYADAQVALLREGLRDLGRDRDTLLVVTADHGEAFGQHDLYGHASGLHDEQIHVPLLIRLPADRRWDGSRVAAPVELIDIAPTIADVAGVEAGSFDGRSLRSLWTSSAPDASRPARAFGRGMRAVVLGDLKLIIEGDAVELFDLASDPGERADLSEARPADVENLRRLDLSTAEEPRTVPEVGPDKAEQLRKLGYLLE